MIPLLDDDNSVVKYYALCLGNLGKKDEENVARLLADKDALIRCKAVSVLYGIGTGKSKDRLTKCMEGDENLYVRLVAAKALALQGEVKGLTFIMEQFAAGDAELRNKIAQPASAFCWGSASGTPRRHATRKRASRNGCAGGRRTAAI